MTQPLRVINGGYVPTLADIAREREMLTVLEQIQAATHRGTKVRLWDRYRRLHSQRSDEFVQYLEIRQGLRHG